MKLGKQLSAIRRELAANPKKSVVLLVLLAAAAWFWGPIVWRTLGGKTAAPAAVPTPVAGGQTPAAGTDIRPATASVPSGKPLVDWRQLLAARGRDPLTQPATFDPQWPQPFKLPDAAANLASGTDAVGQVSTPFAPAEVGLVLQSIVYGSSNRMAVINGEVYHEGSEVAVAAAEGSPVSFELVRIERSRVALKRHDRQYWLEFPRPKLNGTDRIEARERAEVREQTSESRD